MRYPNVRRIVVALVLFPLFIVLLVINKIFLCLDYLLVPFFLFQKVERPVFIVATPRSGTTYLYHSLANKAEDFTCFKLWEIVLAPSVIQKIFWLGIIRLDRLIGNPIKWIALKTENLLIGKLKSIHPISLNMPEEDEAVLLWDLNSIYLNFFYPDSHFFDDYLLFDKNLTKKKRNKIMRSYRNYVRRHNFVFNRKGKKQFLSKNPLMMCKLESLNETFPDALVLNINRAPDVTIPSTLALNRALYGIFTSMKVPAELEERTKPFLIQWYRMSQETLDHSYKGRHLVLDFKDLIQQSSKVQEDISNLIRRNLGTFLLPKKSKGTNHKSKNEYQKLSAEELETILHELPFLKKYCK